jgi:predicted ATPase
MPGRISRLTICGFKSIQELKDFEPGQINVLIGPNAAGKSNFISFFRMLGWMMANNLQEFVKIQSGGADSLLFNGAAVTETIRAEIRIATDHGNNDYQFRLAYTSGDTLTFLLEKYRFSSFTFENEADWIDLKAPHQEAKLLEAAEGNQTARFMKNLLHGCACHQFHNTSRTSRIRQYWKTQDNRHLKEDAGNLAPFLLRLREHEQTSYRKIEETFRLIMPMFAEFELYPEGNSVLLKWREKGSDRIFAAHEASDGMLRAMALVTLLNQPSSDLPDILIIDEPELGLHPYAIQIIGGLLQSASEYCQIFIATQSPIMVDQFEPDQVVVVERQNQASTYRKLREKDLHEWLQEYSLGQLWQKNLTGGTPL